jgi:site-specific DNA-cytosine methylase
MQEIDGVRRIICCASRKYNCHECNYDVRRKECLCNVYAVRKFREYLQGNHFTLETDHRNLLWLSKVEPQTQQLYRWALELSTLDYTVKHVPGSSLKDADMLSRAPLPVAGDSVDEDEEWQQYQINAVDTPNEPQYKVIALGFGIGCDVMATANTPFKVVGGCEVDPVAIQHFEQRTGAPCYGSIQDLDRKLEDGLDLGRIDVVSLTVSCSSRSRLNRINKKPVEHNDGHLFTQSIATIGKINPRMCYVEMVCSDPGHNDPQDFHAVEKALGELFPHVQSRVMQMSKHGAYTDRCRYVCWASRCDTPIQWPEESTSFPGLQGIMLEPSEVPLTCRAEHYTPARRDYDRGPFNAKKLGTVTKGDGNRASDSMHNRLYCPSHPCPTFTSAYTFSGNKGSQWYLDAWGPRQLTLNEECDVHNFDDTAKAFLATLSHKDALGYIARSIPVAPLASMYERFLACLQGDDNAPFKPMPCDYDTEDPHQTAILAMRVWQAMPSLDEFRAAQQADPDIAPLFKYHQGDRKVAIPSTYQRELPHTVVQDGIIYYRTLLGDDESLVQAVLLPKALIPKVLGALHDSPIYCHPGVNATLTIVRQKVYWKHMVKDIKTYIRLCEVCMMKRSEILKHAGKQVSEFYYMPFQRIGIDLVGELPRCDGDCWILHIVCWASGFNYIACLPDKKASTVAAELHKYFLLFGQPTDAIVTDNGKEFVNAAFDELTEKWGCRTIRTCPYHPKGNSRTERRHRECNTILRTAVNRYGESWKVGAYLANWALNVRPRSGSTHCPYELLLGFKPTVPGEKSVEELDGLRLDKATLSDPELLKHLDLHRCWALDNNAALQKEFAMNSKLREDQRRYTITYSPGDLVNVTRPRLGQRSKGTATRLMYQQVGPFEVVKNLGNNAYRLRKLGTDHVSNHNVQHLHPYLTKEAYEQQVVLPAQEEAADATEPMLETGYVPQAGDHLLYLGFATSAKPFLLVKVNSYDERTGEVAFQFYNNDGNSGILNGHRLCWTTPPGEDGDEIQSMRRPTSARYEAFCESDTLDKFCLHPMPIKRLSNSIRLTQKDVDHAMRLRRLPTLAITTNSLGGRVQRRPGMTTIAMLATMSKEVTANAVESMQHDRHEATCTLIVSLVVLLIEAILVICMVRRVQDNPDNTDHDERRRRTMLDRLNMLNDQGIINRDTSYGRESGGFSTVCWDGRRHIVDYRLLNSCIGDTVKVSETQLP